VAARRESSSLSKLSHPRKLGAQLTCLGMCVTGSRTEEGDGAAAAGHLLYVSGGHLLPSHTTTESPSGSTGQVQ